MEEITESSYELRNKQIYGIKKWRKAAFFLKLLGWRKSFYGSHYIVKKAKMCYNYK